VGALPQQLLLLQPGRQAGNLLLLLLLLVVVVRVPWLQVLRLLQLLLVLWTLAMGQQAADLLLLGAGCAQTCTHAAWWPLQSQQQPRLLELQLAQQLALLVAQQLPPLLLLLLVPVCLQSLQHCLARLHLFS
jgi:hypothetical protein